MISEAVFEMPGTGRPMLLVNAVGKVVLANPPAVKVFGEVLEQEAASLAAIWSSENPLDATSVFADPEQIPAARTTLTFRVADGTARRFLLSVCPFKSAGDRFVILQFFPEASHELAGHEPDEAALQNQKLECALQLARTVALDFNNALTSILGHTSLLLSKAGPDHPWRRSLLEVEKSAERAAEIAQELGAFSRPEKDARRQPPGNLNTVAQRCVEFFQSQPASKIQWQLRLERELYEARFDEAKVQQALTKVLENAVEACNGDARIGVESRNVLLTEPTQDLNAHLPAGAHVCLEVTDTGGGINLDILPRIFEPFFTTKKNHRGLGLAWVYGIVTNHGGGVAVSSHPGEGTSVRLYLPAEKRVVTDMAGDEEDWRGAETILIVDDEGLLLTMAETILTDYGYRVLTADSGRKALAMLSGGGMAVDLVITDLVMPGMGGRELVERIRQLLPSTPILCTSGCHPPAEKQQMGAAYLQKPFTSAGLLRKVRQALGPTTVVD